MIGFFSRFNVKRTRNHCPYAKWITHKFEITNLGEDKLIWHKPWIVEKFPLTNRLQKIRGQDLIKRDGWAFAERAKGSNSGPLFMTIITNLTYSLWDLKSKSTEGFSKYMEIYIDSIIHILFKLFNYLNKQKLHYDRQLNPSKRKVKRKRRA